MIGATTVWLDSTSIAQVGSSLGAGAIVGDTTGHDRLMTACYSVGSGRELVTVRLRAQAFIDEDVGLQEAMAALPVSGASIARGADARAPSRFVGSCAPLLVAPAEVRWWNGLRLGMTRLAAERLLGPPRKTEKDEAVYEYDDPDFTVRRIDAATGESKQLSVHVTFGFRVRYDGGVITRIEAWYGTEANDLTGLGRTEDYGQDSKKGGERA